MLLQCCGEGAIDSNIEGTLFVNFFFAGVGRIQLLHNCSLRVVFLCLCFCPRLLCQRGAKQEAGEGNDTRCNRRARVPIPYNGEKPTTFWPPAPLRETACVQQLRSEVSVFCIGSYKKSMRNCWRTPTITQQLRPQVSLFLASENTRIERNCWR